MGEKKMNGKKRASHASVKKGEPSLKKDPENPTFVELKIERL